MPNMYMPLGGRMPLYRADLALDAEGGKPSDPAGLLGRLSAHIESELGISPAVEDSPDALVFVEQREDAPHASTVHATLAVRADPSGAHTLLLQARTSYQALPGRIARPPVPRPPRLVLCALRAAEQCGLSASAFGMPVPLASRAITAITLQEALACLGDPARLVPVVLVSSRPDGDWAAAPDDVARLVAGAAPVWSYDESDASLAAMAALAGNALEPSSAIVAGPALTGSGSRRISVAPGLTERVAYQISSQVAAEGASVRARMVAQAAGGSLAEEADKAGRVTGGVCA